MERRRSPRRPTRCVLHPMLGVRQLDGLGGSAPQAIGHHWPATRLTFQITPELAKDILVFLSLGLGLTSNTPKSTT
jgi:hypothetical protein